MAASLWLFGTQISTLSAHFFAVLPPETLLLATVVAAVGRAAEGESPLPRPARRRLRDRDERGLPTDKELARLARHFFEVQSRLWPDLAARGLFPEPTDELVGAMVADFKHRHRGRAVAREDVQAAIDTKRRLGGIYARYSCDNSDPNSILDQVANALRKAREEGTLVPWQYVYADYSVSGLDASRRGYNSYKALLQDRSHQVETTYVDDFTRASRDELEWWKLAHLVRRLGRRMVGASDRFDLSSPDWDIKMTMFGLLSRLFVRSLQQKVVRGMRGAAGRGTVLGKLPLGFTRQPARTSTGEVIRRPDGRPRHEPCHDPDTAAHVVRAFELFAHKKWSYTRIAKSFNQHRVDGWEGWAARTIAGMLANAAYIGVFIWNRTRREYDWESEKWVVVRNPRSEWEVCHRPDLAIIGTDLWRAARRRAAEMRRNDPRTGRPPSRNQKSATTLFSGTLYCACGKELTLNRSAGKYKQMHCLNGANGTHGCTLRTSKSVGIIERCILGYLKEAILTEEFLKAVVREANDFLAKDAARPRPSVQPLRRKVERLKRELDSLFDGLSKQTDDAARRAYDARIAQRQRELDQVHVALRKAEAESAETPPPLDLARVKTYVADLRGLLNADVPAAAESLRTLTGRIVVQQVNDPSRKTGAPWTATFTPHVVGLLRKLTKQKDYPDSVTLEYLSTRNWTTPKPATITVGQVPKYELLAPKFLALKQAGASLQAIATAHGLCWQYANEVIRFAETGKRPQWGNKRKKKATKLRSAPRRLVYKEIAPLVAELFDVRKLMVRQVRQVLRDEHKVDVSTSTIHRAYHFARPDLADKACQSGHNIRGRRWTRIGEGKYEQIRELLRKGLKPADIAAKVGCGTSTVRREARRLRDGSTSSATSS